MVQFSHPYMTTGKTIAFTIWTFVCKVMSLFFNTLSRVFIGFFSISKRLLILWLWLPLTVILEPKRVKFDTFSPSVCHELMGPDAIIFVFWMLNFKPAFSLWSLTFIKRFFSSSLISATGVISSAYLRLLIFLLEVLIPSCKSSSPAFHMVYSAYKLNKQGDSVQPWCTHFPVLTQFHVRF